MSTTDTIFEQTVSADSKRDLINELVDAEQNIDLKTQIENVNVCNVLETLTEQIDERHLTKTSELLRFYMTKNYRLNLSKDRKSRAEYITALQALANVVEETTPKTDE